MSFFTHLTFTDSPHILALCFVLGYHMLKHESFRVWGERQTCDIIPMNCYVEVRTRDCRPQKMQPPTSCGQSRFLEEAEYVRQRGLTFQGVGIECEKHQRHKRPRTARSLVSWGEIKEMRLRNSQRWRTKKLLCHPEEYGLYPDRTGESCV